MSFTIIVLYIAIMFILCLFPFILPKMEGF